MQQLLQLFYPSYEIRIGLSGGTVIAGLDRGVGRCRAIFQWLRLRLRLLRLFFSGYRLSPGAIDALLRWNTTPYASAARGGIPGTSDLANAARLTGDRKTLARMVSGHSG